MPRGAKWGLEQRPAPAASCVSKSEVNRSESAFATASPASVGRAVFLRPWPASRHPTRSLAPQPNTFASATRAPGSGSGSARCAGRPCSTPKKVTKTRRWPSRWAPSPIRAFRRREIPSTTAADIPGFDCRPGRRPTTWTPREGEPWPNGARRYLPPNRHERAMADGPGLGSAGFPRSEALFLVSAAAAYANGPMPARTLPKPRRRGSRASGG